jgi:phage terminase large subunit-like protein
MTPKWNTACPDWEERIIKGKSLIPFEPLFPESAERAWNIFKCLHITDVKGSPTFEEISRPWVKDFVKAVFGAYDQKSKRMLIREFFLFVSKKNSKSTLAAGIMMTALILNWRDSAEFIILAPTVKVAANSFSPAENMCREDIDQDLNVLMHVQGHLKKIRNLNSNAFLNVVAADSQTVSGIKATSVFIDELHEFGRQEKSEGMLIEATGGLMSRPEGFIIYATTQSEEPPAGIFGKKLNYARKVRDGEIEDNTFLPILYEFPKSYLKDKSYLDPKNFYITNPNFGASVDETFLKSRYKQSVEDGDESVQKFIAKHLNIQVGMSLKSQRWTGADFWERAGEDITLDTILDVSDVVVIGVDGGGLDDLLGVAVVGRHAETRDWLLWIKAWLHPIAMERRKSEKSKYMDFAKDGDLVIVDRVGQDMKEFGDLVMYCESSGLLDRIGFDPYCIGDIVAEIESRDFPKINPKSEKHDRLMHVPQGWRLSGAIKTTERRLAGTDESGKRMIHANQPLMSWCVGNARCEVKGNNLYITKQASGTAKIDPLMAAFDAVSLMALNPAPRYGQVSDNYESVI